MKIEILFWHNYLNSKPRKTGEYLVKWFCDGEIRINYDEWDGEWRTLGEYTILSFAKAPKG